MGIPLSEATLALLDGKNYAVLATGLSWKYDGKDPDPDRPGAVRVIVRMVVQKATGYAA